MIIFFGSRLCGRVDDVPGLFYVKTRFLHLQYIPLVPTRSYVILEGSEADGGFHGIPIGLSIKSVLMAWFRSATVLGALASGIVGLGSFLNQRRPAAGFGIVCLAAALGCIGLFWLSRKLAHASPRRARELAANFGIPQEALPGARHPLPVAHDAPDQPLATGPAQEKDDVFRIDQ
jgi:hypothetical protein